MRVLVYGAGVLGCELAHILIQAGNDVTILARGAWKTTLEEKGLIIRHYVQLQTTKDQVKVIESLEVKDTYDLIFVVMQFGQLKEVLPVIAKNASEHIIFVGNNMYAESTQQMITDGYDHKEIAFGFQSTGGRREKDKVISVHATVGMTIGPLNGELSNVFKTKIERAFQNVKYRLTWEQNMDAWLKCHLAFILPIAYVCYAVDCHLRRATKIQLNMIIEAAKEAHVMLKKLGYPIRPDGEEEFFTTGREKAKQLLWIMAKTPLGRLAASDHCRNAVHELSDLDQAFENLREQAAIPMPAWEQLRKQGQPGVVGVMMEKVNSK